MMSKALGVRKFRLEIVVFAVQEPVVFFWGVTAPATNVNSVTNYLHLPTANIVLHVFQMLLVKPLPKVQAVLGKAHFHYFFSPCFPSFNVLPFSVTTNHPLLANHRTWMKLQIRIPPMMRPLVPWVHSLIHQRTVQGKFWFHMMFYTCWTTNKVKDRFETRTLIDILSGYDNRRKFPHSHYIAFV